MSMGAATSIGTTRITVSNAGTRHADAIVLPFILCVI
jgi:hypothetical protein